MNLKTQGCRTYTRGIRKLCRNTGTYSRPAGPWLHMLSIYYSTNAVCSSSWHFLHLPHNHLNNGANCKDREIIIKSWGKYANRKLYKLRGGWENKDNQEYYQHAPGVQALEAWGGARARRGGAEPPQLLVWYLFSFMNLLSWALKNPDRCSSSTLESGRKWKLGISYNVYSLPSSFTMFILKWQLQTCIKMMPMSSPLCSKTFSGFYFTQSKSQSPHPRPQNVFPSPVISVTVFLPCFTQPHSAPCRSLNIHVQLSFPGFAYLPFPLSALAQRS